MKIILPDGSVQEAEDELRAIRHTASHVLAQAVKRLYPDAKLAIGPAIDDGFYYDFEFPFSFSEENLKAVEEEMRKIVKESLSLQVYEKSKKDCNFNVYIFYSLYYHRMSTKPI